MYERRPERLIVRNLYEIDNLLMKRVGLFLIWVSVSFLTIKSHAADRPQWVEQHGRQVINGDILHSGMGLGNSPGEAQTRAEEMAIRSMVLECSLAHKDIIISDRHIEQTATGYRAYARASLSYEDCERAKKARGEQRAFLESEALRTHVERSAADKSAPVLPPLPEQNVRKTHFQVILELPGFTTSTAADVPSARTLIGVGLEWRFLSQWGIRMGFYSLSDTTSPDLTASSTYGGTRYTLSLPYFFNDPDHHQFTLILAPEFVQQSYPINGIVPSTGTISRGDDMGFGGSLSAQYKLSEESPFIFRANLGVHFISQGDSLFKASSGGSVTTVDNTSTKTALSGFLGFGFSF